MPTLNERAWQLCDAMVADADRLGIAVSTLDCGTRIIDCGVKATGSIEAGLRTADVCMAGLGKTWVLAEEGHTQLPWRVERLYDGPFVYVSSEHPVAACMASQYAGWEIKGEKFFAMGSGPMRAAACREELFQHIGHCEKPDVCVGILEASKLPPDSVCIDVADKCGIQPDRLTLCVAGTASAAGTVQIVARSMETALHKFHVLGFDVSRIALAAGCAPLPPIAGDDLTAIGWTNDAILYGSTVSMVVRDGAQKLDEFGPRVPSSASPDFGRPFKEIFERYNGDFYRIDPMLFSPALIVVANHDTGEKFDYGLLAPDVLKESFGGAH